ncbi:MAG: hypothetical protein IT331_02455 [Anaerolineae bacterium]|nr:hypothetical protein [Anaerolineae bacterium]
MNTGNSSRDTIALAGWLFADLLLGLGLLFFVAASKGTPPVPTPTITPTASLTFTPTPTITRLPTYTPYPTFTPIYTFTPYPTFTPFPPNLTYTPYPTFTPIPPEWTYTPYPTYTPFPPVATQTPRATFTPLSTYTPYPTVVYGLSGTPFVANFKVSPATARALLTGSEQARARLREEMRAQLRTQVQQCLARFNNVERVGVALIFGSDSSPTIGNRLAEETARILSEAYPRIFDGTVMKTYHFISGDPSASGDVEVELYFVGETGRDDPVSSIDSVCNP